MPSAWLNPAEALACTVLGLLAIYWELVRPGRVIPGVVGVVLAVCGVYFIWRAAPSPPGVALVAVAGVMFAAELYCVIAFLFGVVGAASLTAGFCLLFSPARIPLWMTVPLGVFLGGVTAVLCWSAKRARRNKGLVG